MKVVEYFWSTEYESRNHLEIDINDGAVTLNMGDGEPEDNRLTCNFNDCMKIVGVMRLAYEAGKRGDSFELIRKECPPEEDDE